MTFDRVQYVKLYNFFTGHNVLFCAVPDVIVE